MRPERLTLKGFGVFRDYTEIDFSGIELFALTGSTGSGKTTVLDGICFALYGSVPRHGRGAVAPIVTQGLLEATVALSFSLGEDLFSVARRIKRNPRGKGAVTTEASLERGVEVLATGGQVTDRVTELLGLDFDQFTTCVLLPQGEFARFLHDKPADRQDLLAALLDLGIYDRIAQLALNRQRLADDRLRMIDQRLERIGAVTADDLTEVRSAEDALVRLLEWLEDTTPELAALDSEARELTLESDRCRMMLATVRALESPSDLQEVGDHVATLEAEAAEARLSLDAARARQGEVLDQGTSLPAGSQIKTWIEARRNLDASSRELEPARKAVVESLATLTEAGNAVVAAREVERAAADGDRAAHLRRGLEVGDACPVCGQPIHEVPPLHESAETVLAERHLAECERAEQVARKVHADAENQLHRLEARIADLSRQLETVPDLSGLEVLQRQVDEYEASLASTQTEVESASSRLERIERQRRKISEREAAIRSGLQSSWSRAVQSGLEPPPFDLDDPFRSWRELGEWRVATEPRLIEAAEKASTRLEEVGRRRGLVVEAIDKRLGDHNIERGSLPPRDAVVDSISGARTRREKLEEALEELAARIVEKETVSQDQRLARQLGLELRADRFKKWLFDEVFASLVAGANQRLAELTGGQYELAMAGRDFEVIDNFSAGNRRSVRTLSGGETFLVSLALALALAEQVAEGQAGNSETAGRLDSFFLDEGFGTLDAESLELVAAVITDLGASGKTVGIVTHVPELAEQMPVRYEIRKSGDGATVGMVKV